MNIHVNPHPIPAHGSCASAGGALEPLRPRLRRNRCRAWTRLTRLKALDLSENLLLRVPPCLSSLQGLENLALRDNSLLQVC